MLTFTRYLVDNKSSPGGPIFTEIHHLLCTPWFFKPQTLLTLPTENIPRKIMLHSFLHLQIPQHTMYKWNSMLHGGGWSGSDSLWNSFFSSRSLVAFPKNYVKFIGIQGTFIATRFTFFNHADHRPVLFQLKVRSLGHCFDTVCHRVTPPSSLPHSSWGLCHLLPGLKQQLPPGLPAASLSPCKLEAVWWWDKWWVQSITPSQ